MCLIAEIDKNTISNAKISSNFLSYTVNTIEHKQYILEGFLIDLWLHYKFAL